MIINNKDLIQSYILTTSQYNFSVYEKRILYRIVEVLQAQLKGKKLKYAYDIHETMLKDRDFAFPLVCFLKNENDNNYVRVKDALRELSKKTIEYEDEKVWQLFSIIERPEILKNDSIVKLRLSPDIYQAFLNFSRGFRKYELKVAMKFESAYSMRIYELLSGKKEAVVYNIRALKKMFGLENKYKRGPDFIKRVIDPAKKDLTKHAPYSFEFETIKSGRYFTHIRFSPFYIPKNRDPELEENNLKKQTSIHWDLDRDVVRALKDQFGFTSEGLKNNREMLSKAAKMPAFKDICSDIKGMIRKFDIKNPAGFFISEIKKHLEKKTSETF